MSFVKNVIGGIASGGFKEIADGIGNLANSIRTAITGVDVEKKAELEKIIVEADILQRKSQKEINKLEAVHVSVFVAGWRPFIGWVCGFGLAYNFIVHPLIIWGVQIAGIQDVVPPVLAIGELMPLLLALLGLGGLRTYEKLKGVQHKH